MNAQPTRKQLIEKVNAAASAYMGFQVHMAIDSKPKPRLLALLDRYERAAALKAEGDQLAAPYAPKTRLWFAVAGKYPAPYIQAMFKWLQAYDLWDGHEPKAAPEEYSQLAGLQPWVEPTEEVTK